MTTPAHTGDLVPPGGTADQVLTKQSGLDGDTAWEDVPSGASVPDPIEATVTIEPATTTSDNAGLRIESPALVADYSYIVIAALQDPDNPGQYLNLFNVDSAGEMTLVARDTDNGAIPFSIVKPNASVIFKVDDAGRVILPLIPTADPHVAGALWSSSGTVHVSAG